MAAPARSSNDTRTWSRQALLRRLLLCAAGNHWVPIAVGVGVALASVSVWQALVNHERLQINRTVRAQADSVRNEIQARMDSHILALLRMARRAALQNPQRREWEADAALYVAHYQGYEGIAWIDPVGATRWWVGRRSQVVPGAAGSDVTSRPALVRPAESQSVDALSIDSDRGAALQVNVPIHATGAFHGWIVGLFRTSELLETLLGQHIAPGYSITVLEGNAPIFRRGPPSPAGAVIPEDTVEIGLPGVVWLARVEPDVELLTLARSPLPLAVLAGGLFMSVVLGVVAYLAQMARTQARQAKGANRELVKQVAERRQAEASLRKLSRAVEQSPTMVMITDTTGAIEYVNPRFTQLTGYALNEIKGQNPRILKSGATPPEVYAQLWATITAGREWRGELQNCKKNGDRYWEQAAISAIREPDGTITHFLAEMEDVTERKQLEQRVQRQQQALIETEALSAMGRAATTIAHDLRNPLSSVKMALQIIAKERPGERSEQTRELHDIAHEQIRYMDEVLFDVLTYARPNALTPEWLNVDKLLDAAIVLAQREIEERRVEVTTQYEPRLPTLHGDPNKLRQTFANLIANAAQATEGLDRESPRVSVRVGVMLAGDTPHIRTEITDNGWGIPAQLRNKVFEPFFTTRAKGTGLGLSIVKRIIQQHCGSVVLEPASGHGTRAIVVLPTGLIRPTAAS